MLFQWPCSLFCSPLRWVRAGVRHHQNFGEMKDSLTFFHSQMREMDADARREREEEEAGSVKAEAAESKDKARSALDRLKGIKDKARRQEKPSSEPPPQKKEADKVMHPFFMRNLGGQGRRKEVSRSKPHKILAN